MLRKLRVVTFFLLFISVGLCATKKKADLVVYSFDRPMQLFALLESVEFYVTGLGNTVVIYRSSDDNFSRAYEEVITSFPDVIFIRQGANPRVDFKPLTLWSVFAFPNDYILFAVDDIIVKDCINVSNDIKFLEQYGAYGVFYRLGLNLSHCYPRARDQRVPFYEFLEGDLYAWRCKNGEYDWCYPHTVDMTLYRKRDIAYDLYTMNYHSPNTFEGAWSGRVAKIIRRCGLFYNISKIVNIPLNKVQKDCSNKHMNDLSPRELLDLFNQGLKIDIFPFHRIENDGAHTEYIPTFTWRNGTNFEKSSDAIESELYGYGGYIK